MTKVFNLGCTRKCQQKASFIVSASSFSTHLIFYPNALFNFLQLLRHTLLDNEAFVSFDWFQYVCADQITSYIYVHIQSFILLRSYPLQLFIPSSDDCMQFSELFIEFLFAESLCACQMRVHKGDAWGMWRDDDFLLEMTWKMILCGKFRQSYNISGFETNWVCSWREISANSELRRKEFKSESSNNANNSIWKYRW